MASLPRPPKSGGGGSAISALTEALLYRPGSSLHTAEPFPGSELALGRKNWMFAGSERGGKAMAIAYTLIETAKLNGVDQRAWLTEVLARIAGHKTAGLDELLPWSYTRKAVYSRGRSHRQAAIAGRSPRIEMP